MAGISAWRLGAAVLRVSADWPFGADATFRPRREAGTVSRRTGFCWRRCSGSRGFIRRPTFDLSAGRCAAWCRPSCWWFREQPGFRLARASSASARRFISCQNSAGRPLQSRYFYALFAFWTLLLFGSMARRSAGRAGAGVAAGVEPVEFIDARRSRHCDRHHRLENGRGRGGSGMQGRPVLHGQVRLCCLCPVRPDVDCGGLPANRPPDPIHLVQHGADAVAAFRILRHHHVRRDLSHPAARGRN